MSPTLAFFMLGAVILSVSAQRRPPNFSLEFMPNTAFSCADKVIGGYYADPEAQCQMFHLCIKVAGEIQDFRFLCPNDTSFDQENQICDDWYNIDCEADLLRDKVDLYRVGFDSSKVAKATSRTPTPVGPSSVKPVVPSYTRQKTFQGGNSIDEDDTFLRSDTGDRRLQNEFLRGSSSSNFYSNRNGKDDYVDDPVIITKDSDVSKVSNDFEKKKNKATVRKLLTGKRPIGQAANSVGNEQPVEQTPKYQNLYRSKQTSAYTTAASTAAPTQTTTAQPTESTTQYVRPKNSNLRFRGSLNYNGPQKGSTYNDGTTSYTATATQPTVDYYKKTSNKPSYNKNNYYSQTQQPQQVTQQQNYNANQQQNYNTNQQQNYNTNQQQNYNANQQVNYNANSQTQAQVSYNNGNQQVQNANNQAITANQQFYNANQQYNANQRNLVNGINQQAYNVNNLQATTTNNQNGVTQQQQNYNTQQYNNGPTQVPLDYFKKTSVKQSTYKQADTASQTQNTQSNAQITQKQTTTNYNDFYRTSTTSPSTTFNYNEYYRTSTNSPSTTFNYQEFYRTSTNTPPTANYNEFYRTSTSTPVNYNEYYKSSTTSPSTTFDYNEYYRTSAAALPSSTANYYDPYNSYKEQFLANNAYEEDVQDEFLKTAPSNNLRPSEINAFSKAYNKPVSFNASLTAKLNYNTKAETTLKPIKEKTAVPTQQTYYSPKQNTQTSVTHSVSQEKQTTVQQKTNETPAPVAQQTAQSAQPKAASKTPTLSLEEYKKILEKPSDYDYAYYDGGDPNRDYDGVERISEEFSKTKNIKKA